MSDFSVQVVGVAREPSTSGCARKTGDNVCHWHSLRSLSRSVQNMFNGFLGVYSWSGINWHKPFNIYCCLFSIRSLPLQPRFDVPVPSCSSKVLIVWDFVVAVSQSLEDLHCICLYVNTSPEGSTDWSTNSIGEEPLLQATCAVATRHCVAPVALSGELFPLIHWGTWTPWMVLGAEPWPVWIVEHAGSSHIALDS